MSYSSLQKYYKDLYVMWHHHKMAPSEFEALVPFERDIITELMNQQIRDEAELRRLQERQVGDMMRGTR
jgi:hypothetical protein